MTRGKQFARAVLLASLAAVALVPALAKAEADKTSQREYMRASGKDKGQWVRRGENFVDPVTGAAKNVHTFVFPDATDDKVGITRKADIVKGRYGTSTPGTNCSSSCHGHQRFEKVVETPGFQNAFGSGASYSGTIDPYALMEDPANTTGHSALYKDGTGEYQWPDGGPKVAVTGCGVCHSEMAAKQRGLDRIRGCVDCHNFKLDVATSVEKGGNLHGTHIPFLQAEMPLADSSSTVGQTSCAYCHDPSDKGGTASCWNCHLSGHWPKVPYWKATP